MGLDACAPAFIFPNADRKSTEIEFGFIAVGADALLRSGPSGSDPAFPDFGFLTSRLVGFCPLAEGRFDKSAATARRRYRRRFKTVLRRHPFVKFVVVPDTILQQISSRRERGGDVVSARGLGLQPEPILHPDDLPLREKMRRGFVANGTGLTLKNGRIHHGCSGRFRVRPQGPRD